MTTAARPTWNPAIGGFSLRDKNNVPIRQVCARDLATHSKLKYRFASSFFIIPLTISVEK